MNPSNVPLPNSEMTPANDPDLRLSEFLGQNLDAFRELVTFAEVAEGFTLAIVEINFVADGDLLMQALHQHAVAETVQFIELDFSERVSFSLLAALNERLTTVERDPQRQPVLLVRGLATAIGVKGDYPNFLNELNYSRDQLAQQVTYPLVLFLPDYAITRLGQYAKDLWTWQSGLFAFRTTSQTVDGVQTQLRHPHPTLPADSKPVKQDRIDQLERLLSEQLNHGDPSTDSAQDCINLALELGNAYRGLSDYAQAQRYYHKALNWAETVYSQGQQADALYGLAQVDFFEGANTKSMARHDQALDLYRAVEDHLGEANTLQAVGDVLQFLKRSPEALQHYKQALDLYRAVEDHLGEANTLLAVGNVLQFLKRSPEALQHYEQAIDTFRAVGDRVGEANTLLAVGDVLQFLSCSPEALQHYEQALDLYRAVGFRLGKANTLLAVGNVLQFLKRSPEALQHYEQALDLYQATGERLGEANTLLAVGNVLQFFDRRTEALQHYKQALDTYRTVGDRVGEANTLKAVGNVLQFLKRSPDALQHYKQALDLYRAVGSRLGEANALKAVGNVLQSLKRSPEALQHYDQALDLYRAVGFRLGEANALKAVGNVLQSLKRNPEALQHYDQALELYQATGARLGEASVLQEFGKMAKDSRKSLAFLQQAQSLYEAIGDRYSQCRNLVNFLADAQLAVGQRAEAIRSLHRAADLALGSEYVFFAERAQNKLKNWDADTLKPT
ncbi:MAG: tetratricopeptide repeat protein [Leptolyngbyaceae cyanobacterium]